jgi:hypothetical protein
MQPELLAQSGLPGLVPPERQLPAYPLPERQLLEHPLPERQLLEHPSEESLFVRRPCYTSLSRKLYWLFFLSIDQAMAAIFFVFCPVGVRAKIIFFFHGHIARHAMRIQCFLLFGLLFELFVLHKSTLN